MNSVEPCVESLSWRPEGVDVAADKDADRGGEDVERGAWKGLEAIRAGVSVATASFDAKSWEGQFKVPSDAVFDVGVRVGHFPIPDAGLRQEEPECLPLQRRRSRQRDPGVAIAVPPP